jgi:carbonic anhydrase/acetyltransferase-like protein (isoleucine patch superfamily)
LTHPDAAVAIPSSRENLNSRSTSKSSVEIGFHVLTGPHASLKGCIVEDECFLATGVKICQGWRGWIVGRSLLGLRP